MDKLFKAIVRSKFANIVPIIYNAVESILLETQQELLKDFCKIVMIILNI